MEKLKLSLIEKFGKAMVRLKPSLASQDFECFYLADPDKNVIEVVQIAPHYFIPYTVGSSYYDKLVEQPLLIQENRLGNILLDRYRTGKIERDLIPSLLPWDVSGVELENDTVHITQRGIGGAPDVIRLWAHKALRYEERKVGKMTEIEMEFPIYEKVTVGLDDTDTSTKGATITTAVEISVLLEKALKYVNFLMFIVNLNWPNNPYKTTNNASSACIFAVKQGEKKKFADNFCKMVEKRTASKNTGVAILDGIGIPQELQEYSKLVKQKEVQISDAYTTAKKNGVNLVTFEENPRGIIGAVSAIGMAENPREALSPVVF
jgi:methanogenesis imperfect marker protein 11